MKTILEYLLSVAFVSIGFLSLGEGIKKKNKSSLLMKPEYNGPKKYGRVFFIGFGILCLSIVITFWVKKIRQL